MTFRSAASSAKHWVDECERFVREYTAGVRAQDLHRLFEHDATEAYGVLRRDQETGPEPEDDLRRFLHRVRIIFLGLSYKLTPARRLLFVLAMLFAVLGLVGFGPEVVQGGRIFFEASRFWFLLSVAALGFLLTLELVDQIRVRDELEVARQLQGDLLPTSPPELDGYEIVHTYRTANEVGGDYYDFPILADGRMALMVGDASGHGMAAGLLMAIANASLKMAIDLDPDPVRVLTLLNRNLCRTGDRRAFMSLFYALLDPASGELTYTCAGHPFPLVRRSDGRIVELGAGGLPLGIKEDLELRQASSRVEPGDLLLAFSDGLPEALDPQGNSFGYERIGRLLAEGGDATAVLDRILGRLESHLAGVPLADDFSLVIVRRKSLADAGA